MYKYILPFYKRRRGPNELQRKAQANHKITNSCTKIAKNINKIQNITNKATFFFFFNP